MSDPELPAHSLALDSRSEGQRFRENLAMRERARKAFVESDNCQVLRRALAQRSRPHRGQYMHGDRVMMWKRHGETDGTWLGPLRVVLQESQHVVWVTTRKLYRVAPEHLRPLSAMEEWSHQRAMSSSNHNASQNMNTPSIIPPHGGIQYHNFINPDNRTPVISTTIPLATGVTLNIPENNPNHEASRNGPNNAEAIHSDQPGGEPVSNSSTPSVAPMPESNPVEVPVPDDDEGLFAQPEDIFHVETDQCWKLEVNVCAHDIANWREEGRPHEMAFLVSAAKRKRNEVKLSQLSAEDKACFHEAKMKEIESGISTETISKILRHQIPKENILMCRWILTWKGVDENDDK